jgi:hypothetical protein
MKGTDMRIRTIVAWAVGLSLLAPAAWAQDKPKTDDKPKPAADAGKPKPAGDKQAGEHGMDAAMHEAMIKAGTPGEKHKQLEPLVGKWSYEIKCWMEPGGEPWAGKGKAETKWILGGRWLEQRVEGEGFEEGTTFHGIGYQGYDNIRGDYVSTWIDDHGTGMMTSYGSFDPAGKVLSFNGHMACMMTGEKERKYRTVVKIESRDKHVFEMHGYGPDGKEMKIMEIVYTRAKS